MWKKLLSRNNSIFMDTMKLHGASHIFLDLGYDYRLGNYKIVNGDNYVGDDYDSYTDALRVEYLRDANFLEHIYQSGITQIEVFKKVWKNINAENLDTLNTTELNLLFQKYIDTLYKQMAFLFTPLFAEKILTEEISTIIKKYTADSEVNELLPILTFPEEHSMIQKEALDFWEMIRLIKKDSSEQQVLIESHVSKWAWLNDHNFSGDFWTIDDVQQRVKVSLHEDPQIEIHNINTVLEQAQNDFTTITRQWNVTDSEHAILTTAKHFVFFRTYRLDMLFYSGFLVQNLFAKIAKNINLSFKDTLMLSPFEIGEALLENTDFKTEVEKRKKSYAIVLNNHQLHIYSGNDSKQYIETSEDIMQVETFKGNSAFRGLVTGMVSVINSKSDFSKFTEGQILVTAMTTPDFVPLMKKCSAIITDEGGITCHAAIVSRELGKPCIIGTKIATKVLKDGDRVEVDAERGVIAILDKK